MISNRFVEKFTRDYFCIDPISIGDPVFESGLIEDYLSCSSINKKTGLLIGISMYNVVDIDFSSTRPSYNTVSIGSKIDIMTKGWIVYKLNKSWKIPFGQKLYYCSKNKEVTWRKTDIKFGKAVSHQNYDGYIKVEINL